MEKDHRHGQRYVLVDGEKGSKIVVTFHDVYDLDWNEEFIKFLYILLEQRKPYQNISHKEMPDYYQHRNFVRSKPYKGWFVIAYGDELVGSVYLGKEDNVGIFLKETCVGMGVGREALKFIYNQFDDVEIIYANIAPLNSGSLCFFSNMGFKYHGILQDKDQNIIQYTYKILNPENLYVRAGALSLA